MSIDDKLGTLKFTTNEEKSHIIINEDFTDEKEIMRIVKACPAELYKYENGKLVFSHEGCLECGTCRVLSHGKVIKSWEYPESGYGVEFHQG